MSQLSDTEIIKKADEIKSQNRRKKEQEEKEVQKKSMLGLVGKCYKGWTGCFADTDGVEIFRVIGTDWHQSYVNVEHWKYAHSGYYCLELISWSDVPEINSIMQEVSEPIFYQLVTKFMKKINVIEAINEETDH